MSQKYYIQKNTLKKPKTLKFQRFQALKDVFKYVTVLSHKRYIFRSAF